MAKKGFENFIKGFKVQDDEKENDKVVEKPKSPAKVEKPKAAPKQVAPRVEKPKAAPKVSEKPNESKLKPSPSRKIKINLKTKPDDSIDESESDLLNLIEEVTVERKAAIRGETSSPAKSAKASSGAKDATSTPKVEKPMQKPKISAVQEKVAASSPSEVAFDDPSYVNHLLELSDTPEIMADAWREYYFKAHKNRKNSAVAAKIRAGRFRITEEAKLEILSDFITHGKSEWEILRSDWLGKQK